MTDFALKKILNKLFFLSSDLHTQIRIFEPSIRNNRQDIYKLKDQNQRKSQGQPQSNNIFLKLLKNEERFFFNDNKTFQ